jgi:hypothetical protein
MKRTLLLIGCLAPLFAGCNPYEFKMGTHHVVSCKVLTSLPSVEQGTTTATLHDTGAIGMSYFGATQYDLAMGIRLVRGEGLRILLRPDVEQRDIKDSGIVVTLTRAGSWVDSGQHFFLQRPDLGMPVGQNVPVFLLSENNYTQVVIGCDTVYRGWTRKLESDDIVVQALDKSEVEVIDPDWAGLPGR